jgi:hypothetical protein
MLGRISHLAERLQAVTSGCEFWRNGFLSPPTACLDTNDRLGGADGSGGYLSSEWSVFYIKAMYLVTSFFI